MKPVSAEVRGILECAPRPINDTDLGKGLALYFDKLTSLPEGFHELRVIVRKSDDGVLFYLPTLTEIH